MITAGFFAAAVVHAQTAAASANTSSWLDPIKNGAVLAIGWVVQLWVSVIGKLCMSLIGIIISIAEYNDFVTSTAVTNGWVIIRDVVNMFFILILLVIAFATIFNVKEYKYQAMLPRLLIMAVVINFSRTICGIFIDLGQVVMLTFVNGFKAAAGGNFVNALKINELMKFDPAVKPDLMNITGSFILAAIMITITAVVLGAFAIMLVMRVVTLWFLVVLSPLAFMSSVWPSGRLKQNYGKWWDMFLDNIMVGPILAFFLWLSLLVLGGENVATVDSLVKDTYVKEGGISASATQIGSLENMISYLMGIGMLLGSLAMAQGMRAAGAGIAGKALGAIQGYAKGAVMKPISLAGRGLKTVGKRAGGEAYRAFGIKANVDLAVEKFRASGLGRVVAPTKEQKEERDLKGRIKALKSTRLESDAAKAEQLQNNLASQKQKEFETSGVDARIARQRLKNPKIKGSAEEEALAMIVAGSGLMKQSEFRSYGIGRDDKDAKRVESRLRGAAYKFGDKTALIGYSENAAIPGDPLKDIQDIMKQHKNPGEQAAFLKDIKSMSKLGADGMVSNEYAPEFLSEVVPEYFEKMPEKRQKDILDAAIYAEKNAQDKFNSLGLAGKMDALIKATKTGDVDGAKDYTSYQKAHQPALFEEERLETAGKEAVSYISGTLPKSDLDSALEKIVQGAGKADPSWMKDRMGDAMNSLHSVSIMQNTKDASAIVMELQKLRKSLADKAIDLDKDPVTISTGQFDKSGQEMSNLEVMQEGRLYKNLGGAEDMAREMSASGVTEKKRKATAQLVGVSTRYMEDATGTRPTKEALPSFAAHPKTFYGTVRDYYVAEANSRNEIDKITGIAEAGKRDKQVKTSMNRLATSLRIIEKSDKRFSADVNADVEQLKNEIQRLTQLGANSGQADIDALKDMLDKLREKIIIP